MRYAAMVLAGGAGRRMGGPVKPLLEIAGVALLDRVLAAVGAADPLVVVGPPQLRDRLPRRAVLTREQPAGAGPVAAIEAGLAYCSDTELVAVVAADLPFLTAGALHELADTLAVGAGTPAQRVDLLTAGADTLARHADVALYRDEQGRRQSLCAVWRTVGLRRAMAVAGQAFAHGDGAVRVPAKGVSMRSLLAAADVAEVAWAGAVAPPWYDCDTPEDLAEAEAMQ